MGHSQAFRSLAATRHVLAAHPEARVILVSINETPEDIQRAMDAGASDLRL
jgi:DNA-binding NarL/FixJ family response regulator